MDSGFVITKFPEGMTGRQYRKQLGIKASGRITSSKSFKIKSKFKGIKRKNRLGFLIKMTKVQAKNSTYLTPDEMRNCFNNMKLQAFPMGINCLCYVCSNRADIRHHVIPLKNGGRNKANNIVPLCYSCHTKVHPHLQEVNRKKVASRHCVKPKINGPLVSLQEGEKISFVPLVRNH
jgi:5-methylcytosine-specific restriction endonuclease McrA